MSTISDRGYVDHRGQALVPTWLAFAVTRLLEENFTELVDYDFTASMERDLDRIAAGEEDRVAWLRRFYNGQGGDVAPEVAQAAASGDLDAAAAALRAQGLKGLVDNLGEIDARAATPSRSVRASPCGWGATAPTWRMPRASAPTCRPTSPPTS